MTILIKLPLNKGKIALFHVSGLDPAQHSGFKAYFNCPISPSFKPGY